MFPRAAVTVSTCADFVVEGAVDLVLLGSEDGCQIVGHVSAWFADLGCLFVVLWVCEANPVQKTKAKLEENKI